MLEAQAAIDDVKIILPSGMKVRDRPNLSGEIDDSTKDTTD
jgi:hypothetical protein